MKVQERKVYTCEFCGKHYFKEFYALKHEKYCGKNPINIHQCTTGDCEHLWVGIEGNIKLFQCEKKNIDLHTYVAERRGISAAYDTVRMPICCKDYKHKGGAFITAADALGSFFDV